MSAGRGRALGPPPLLLVLVLVLPPGAGLEGECGPAPERAGGYRGEGEHGWWAAAVGAHHSEEGAPISDRKIEAASESSHPWRLLSSVL